jgi:hypothetical protein
MAKQSLELTILRKGRREDVIEVTADPDDVPVLQDSLRAWLTGNKWSAGRWGEFEAEVRRSGENKVLKKVRA